VTGLAGKHTGPKWFNILLTLSCPSSYNTCLTFHTSLESVSSNTVPSAKLLELLIYTVEEHYIKMRQIYLL
jgi:hypothetical protein